MSTFDKREAAYESAFVHDQEKLFLAKAHRNKDLAAWAARVMDKPTDEANAYRDLILSLTVCGDADEAILDRIQHDLHAAGHPLEAAQLRTEMDRLMHEAVAALTAA
jgi:hypothetical protein